MSERNVVKDPASLFFAVKESTTTVYDSDAVEYLQITIDRIRRGLDAMGLTGPDHAKEREEWLWCDAFLKGTQLKLRRAAYEASQPETKGQVTN
jgi:hypothetical protein